MKINAAFITSIRSELKERGIKEPTLDEWKKLAAFDNSDRDLEGRVMAAISMVYGNEPRVLKLNSMRRKD